MLGAIAILFLFVIMMLNLQLAELSSIGKEYTQNLPLGALVGSLFLFSVISILPNNGMSIHTISTAEGSSSIGLGIVNWFNSVLAFGHVNMPSTNIHEAFSTMSVADTTFTNFLQIQSIGQGLYTYGSMWLILTSVILLLAMIGPISLSMNKATTDGDYSSTTTTPSLLNKVTINFKRPPGGLSQRELFCLQTFIVAGNKLEV
ncbi:MAG: hypothetical protein EOP34_04310 [Rickettsiales bacterium]|nr:MAG: hypothetical protein EOP34_04310 [Rickettsiales bacterium]